MSQTMTITLPDDIANKIREIAESNNEKKSKVVAQIIEVGLRSGEPFDVKCPICSTIYKNKLGFCPKCNDELLLREEELKKETQIVNLKKRLEKLEKWKAEGMGEINPYIYKELEIVKEKIKEIENK